ncbi:MAG: UDP-N-acetylmuramoyl-tripeptide--D-alanyl-D-alanine ligase [Alphaproteobacteria bacterium]|nr:UDP-N-acetylmuramoyl-tripeptide--D-alanyl-D-alanine ligase [Alphaproteobacteria bacterium]
MKFDATTLAEAMGGTRIRDAGEGPVWTDTRSLPKGAWFLALRGDRFDGHEYVQKALDAGAIGAIVEKVDPAWSGGIVRVHNTTQALQELGRFARQRFAGPVVGLTGSSGKTTTRALTSLALSSLGPVHQTVGNLNNHLGVPMTLVAVEPEAVAMVVEMGTSSPGEIRFLAEMAQPDIRVIVNVGPAHLEELGGLDGVAFEKGALFRTARPGDSVVVNADDPYLVDMELPDGVRRITVGSGEDVDIRIANVRPSAASLKTRTVFDTPEGRVGMVLPVFGYHFAQNAALALGAAWAAGASLKDAAAAMSAYEPVGMRMRTESVGGIRFFNDAYNANPASMRASLEAFAKVPGRKVAVLGDMLELGPAEDRYHFDTLAHADALGLDLIVLIGERMARADQAVSSTEVWVPDDRAAAGEQLAAWLMKGDQVLVKGSRGARTEEVLESIRTRREA